jgi:hypothetical protein
MIMLCALCGVSPLLAAAEPGQLQLPDFSALAQKASHSVVVSLDPSLLAVAGGVLSADSDPNDEAIKQLLSGLRGVYVRSFIFDHPGDYSPADVDSVRSQLTPAWQPLVSTHDRTARSDVNIYMRRRDGHTDGVVIIATQPQQLTIVNLVGDIDLAKLAQLQGRFGVPQLMGGDALPAPPPHATAPAPPAAPQR